jgi:hypothetical protein
VTLFALVHGAWHGAWCWDRLVGELEGRGHRTAAIDLPIETGSSDTYIDPVERMVDDARDGDDVRPGRSLHGRPGDLTCRGTNARTGRPAGDAAELADVLVSLL